LYGRLPKTRSVGLDQLAPDFATPLIREILALLLCLFAGRPLEGGSERALRQQFRQQTGALFSLEVMLLSFSWEKTLAAMMTSAIAAWTATLGL
ncbi:hypothetical protein, partial [Klebsiella pneumoniae]|uniref:hypothetical protein n=1 Tax=Klebsiella pneumoniae TaxID=573 RepID=UPI0021095F0D